MRRNGYVVRVDNVQSLGGIIKFVNALNISHTSAVESIDLKEKMAVYIIRLL